MARQIILAVDGSSYGEAAFSWYLSNLYRDGDEVHVVTIHDMSQVPVPFVVGPEPMVIPDDWEENIKRSYEETKDRLNMLVERLVSKSIKVKGHLRNSHGSPGAEICKIATEFKANCVVMGSRGMGTFRRTFLGSTSDYVLHHAHCPVMIVKYHQD